MGDGIWRGMHGGIAASLHLEDKYLTAIEYENIQKKLKADMTAGLALM